MLRPAIAWTSIVLATIALARASAPRPASARTHDGYSWPVAPGCTQRKLTYPNFANRVRVRADGSRRPHLGVDLIPPTADLNVYVAKEGVVAVSSPARGSGWGNYLVINHEDGLRTLYAHLAAPSRLHEGQRVSKGDVIGTAGETETFFVHAHFEVQGKGSRDDWAKGRLDPVSVVGPLDDCRNSAAPGGNHE